MLKNFIDIMEYGSYEEKSKLPSLLYLFSQKNRASYKK